MRFLCCLAAVLLVAGLSARADVVSTFGVTGTFADQTTISGTLVIDTTTGVLESGDLSYLGGTFNVLDSAASFPQDGIYFFRLSTSAGTYPELGFGIAGSSLVGFNGGPLCAFDNLNLCNFAGTSQYYADIISALFLDTGTVTGPVATTPEPSSVMLLGTGLLGFAGVVRRRMS